MTASQPVFLRGETPDGLEVSLRPLEKEDMPLLHTWINDPDARENLAVVFPISRQQEEGWLETVTSHDGLPADIALGVYANDKHIGIVGLHNINYIHRYAVTGINIGDKDYRHKKIGATAKRLMVDYAFRDLDLCCLITYVYGHNKYSRKMQKRCGWKKGGRIPRKFLRNGKRTDEITYYILREDWENQK